MEINKQDLEIPVLDEDNQAQVVRVGELRVGVPEYRHGDAAHVLVEGLGNCPVEGLANLNEPLGVPRQRPRLLLHGAHCPCGRAGIAVHDRHVDTGVPQPLQVAHMVLVCIRDEQIAC